MASAQAGRKGSAGRRAAGAERKTGDAPPHAGTKGRSAATSEGEQPLESPSFAIVGVGASAGGLDAFSELLHALPANPGVAFVLVPHLAPQHESVLPTLLAGRTRLPVLQATEGVRVEPDHVYVIPPNVQMGMSDDALHLRPRPSDRSQYTPVDFFLRSLAEAAQDRAIAVILSGTASDGTVGVREIKAAGGIVFAQRPETAKYDGMPRAAIATGVVDLILSPEEIAAEIVRLARHPIASARRAADAGSRAEPVAPVEASEQMLQRVLALLRNLSGVDFTRYKRPTIERRLRRRLMLNRVDRLDQYVRFLEENPAEVDALYRDILIHVTRFFRDPESFEALKAMVFTEILEQHRDEQPIRVWVPGCATGEEAYSVGIALLELIDKRAHEIPVQIFATDVSEAAIEQARTGVYATGIAGDVSPERLRHFFTKVEAGYQVNKTVRDLCVFARQDLTRDPPFSKLDLVVCRNVLIYLSPELQKRLMQIFHYALKPTGFLLLGSAETVGLHSDLYRAVDKRHHLYRKIAGPGPSAGAGFPRHHAVSSPERRPPPSRSEVERTVVAEANRIIQEQFAPAGVLVDRDLQILQFRGQTGAFLEPAPGEPTLSLLKMVRDGLLHAVRAAVQDARRTWTPVRRDGLRVGRNGRWQSLTLHVLPVGSSEQAHLLVLFECLPGTVPPPADATAPAPDAGPVEDDSRIAQLQQEVASSREYLQSIIQELEAANEELQSANEEILSANEELQSTNEELDTAKEELQSTNEELNTVNEELHARNEQLSLVNSDLVNVLGSVQIAIVIVDTQLRIRRFTPMAEKMLNLIASDAGRPISHIKPNIECSDLEELIAHVVDTVTPVEREVRDRQGNWLALRVRPYKNLENRIEGAVLALFDIDSSKRHEEELRRARGYAEAVAQTVGAPILVLDRRLRVGLVSPALCAAVGMPRERLEGRSLYEITDAPWSVERLRLLLEQELPARAVVEGFALGRDGAAQDRLVADARQVSSSRGSETFTLLAIRRQGTWGES